MNQHQSTTARATARPGVRRRLTVLLAAPLLVLSLLGVSVGLAGSASAAPATGWIRAGHLAGGNGAADVRLTPFDGGRSVTVRDVAYGDVTAYRSVPTGLYTVAVRPAGSDMSVTPMVSTNVRVRTGEATSVFAVGDKADVRSEVVRDDLTAPPAGQARVRLLSAAAPDDAVTARLSTGRVLAEDVIPGQSTGYATVPAQTWTIDVSTSASGSGTDQTASGRVPVQAGGVYTLLVLDDPGNGGLRLEAVEDAGGSTMMPTGGVDTGGGGLSDAGSGPGASLTTYGGSAALVLALGLAAGVASRRRTTEAEVRS